MLVNIGAIFYFFYGVPAYFQVVGTFGNGRAAAQFQNVPRKGAGV